MRVRGAGAERQRRQAREVSRYYRCSFKEFWLVLEMGIYCSFDHKLFFFKFALMNDGCALYISPIHVCSRAQLCLGFK